ncbi:MAG: epoxyqueuosine reductase QueH [Candidatus Omnitrophica bacterium]|nr:epoxyqueuosine reductase QueH [Candidatus Omnitrophota bacterium]
MKLLLHICCAPCAIYPLEVLRNKGFEVEGLFYNPNIHPEEEFIKRQEAVKEYSRSSGLDAAYPRYSPDDFFAGLGGRKDSPARCRLCWRLRLRKAAEYAAGKQFHYFTSTLLVSPYQDIEAIREIGEAAAAENNVKFAGEDFRPGFRQAHREAKENGLYCQKYCGCIYSLEERNERVK